MKEQHDLAKWLEGSMTESERIAFENTPEFADYDKIRKYSAMLKGPDFDTDKMYRNVVSHTKNTTPPKVIPIRNWFLRIAAVLIISLGLYFTARNFVTQTQMAANGSMQIFELPDASQVMLNDGSKIEYKRWNWSNSRSLQLDGEAFFKVTKGSTFDVCTNLGKVTVVGTQFNVKARENRFEVACFEGKVRVETKGKTILLTPGMRVAFEDGRPLSLRNKNDLHPLWIKGQISFESETLDAIIAELERQYNITIETQNIRINPKFTGTIPADNLDLALQIISSSYNLKHTKTANGVIFIGK